jgi:hypothetical protein
MLRRGRGKENSPASLWGSFLAVASLDGRERTNPMKRLPSADPQAAKPARKRDLNGTKRAPLTKVADLSELSPEEKALYLLIPKMGEITGTKQGSVSDRITCQIVGVLDDLSVKEKCSATEKIISALELIKELGPEDVTQSMLAAQTIACHNAAMKFMRGALLPGQPSEFVDSNIGRASKLMNIFTAQVELMQKLKGKGSEQKVTVKHVHVYPGGQAIVGTITGGTGG